MKKSKILFPIIALILCICTLCSCGERGAENNMAETSATENPAESGRLNVDFQNGESDFFEAADGWCNGSMFNV
ncbi:MAG: hypothetical protein K2H23_02120, partial [Oscillospiraceae bacterium]|nr:hypothetical protein [Oscillospiraceae bacterium]